MVKGNKDNTLPQDRGWAWAIAAAGFIAHVVMHASTVTNSVMFVEILRKYDVSITAGSLMFMCNTLSFSVSSAAISTFILPKLGSRGCLIVAGLLSFVLSLCASFASDVGFFIAAIAAKGISHGFMFVPSVILIPVYFNKMRSRASTIPWCGSCASSIFGPFIIRAMSKEFGVSGTYFLLAAFELHVCVAALLLRPASAYRFHTDNVNVSLTGNTARRSTCSETEGTTNLVQEDVQQKEKNNLQLQVIQGKNIDNVNESLLPSEYNRDHIDIAAEENVTPKILDPTDVTGNRWPALHRERRNTFLGSVLSLDSEIGTALEVMIQNVTDSPADKGMTKWQKLYRDTSLELRSFRWALLSVLPGSVNLFIIIYMPTISNSQGASLDQAALLVTITGSVDLLSRITLGFIADTHVLSPSKLHVISQMCMGLACHLFRFATSFTSLIPMIIFVGMFIGSRGPLMPLICLEVVGTKRMPQAYGILSMLSTLVSSLFNPALGAIVEATGSFVFVLHIVGTSYILGALLLGFLPLFSRLDIKHGRRSAT